jgi:hypothetical protein
MVAAAVVGAAVVGGVASNQASNRAANAASDAARAQSQAAEAAAGGEMEARERAQGFFQPFEGVAEQGVAGSSFLTDPQERFEFLQNNPLFQLQLENANQRTLQTASAGRRLSFGDTLQQLSNNVLLSSAPLLATQDQNLTNLLQFGGDIATSQANIETGQQARISDLTTGGAAATAAGTVGAANARNVGTAGISQALQTGILALPGESPTSGGVFANTFDPRSDPFGTGTATIPTFGP